MFAAFTLPAWQRLLMALAYAGVVVMAVLAVEGPVPSASAIVASPEILGGVPLTAEATFAVGRWTVLVDGVELPGTAADRVWSGVAAGVEVLVQAERSDAADQSPGALRLRIGDRQVLAWGEGTVSATAAIPHD